MNTRLMAIVRKEFIQLRRDKRMLILILVLPLMQLFLLGYAATNDVRDVPLVVYDQCHCAEGRILLDAYRSADYFELKYAVGSDAELRELIDKGKAGVGLILPPTTPANCIGVKPRWLLLWMAPIRPWPPQHFRLPN